MGTGRTKFKFYIATSHLYKSHKHIIFKDATVTLDVKQPIAAHMTFINCVIRDNIDTYSELYQGTGNLTFINSDIQLSTSDNIAYADDCFSGIITSGNVKMIGGSVEVAAGGTTDGFDANFIYSCDELTMQGVTVKTTGATNGRINLIRNCNKATVNGCYIYLNGTMHSIGHIADTDRTVGGSFTGNYIEYYKTYMRFATISGNTFNHLAAGSSSSNQIVLQCPTNMSGNTFKGSAAYIDAQSQKVIVDRNLHDNGLTIGSAASGSITTNNLQY